MSNNVKGSSLLGVAFLVQFITSFVSGAVIQSQLIVAGNIEETLQRIAGSTVLFRTYILIDVATALGVIFLGTMLYSILKKENEEAALVGLGFYLLEGCLLAVSKGDSLQLLNTSIEYIRNGMPPESLVYGQMVLDRMNLLGSTLHMVVFCLGGFIFYILLDRSRLVPRVLSLWGIVCVPFLLLWTMLGYYGISIPFFLYFPYVPFELVIGVWLLVMGVKKRTTI